jgi:integrase
MIKVYRKGKKGQRRRPWQAKVWFRGRQYSRQASTKRGAVKAGEDLLKEVQQQAERDNRVAPKFFDYCVNDYKPEAKRELGERTYANRTYQIATLVEHFGQLRLDQITEDHLREFRRKRHDEGVGPATINDQEKILKAILNHAKARKQFPVNVPHLKPLKVPKTQGNARAWTDEEIGRLFDCIRRLAVDILAMVVFGLNTGCRKTEIIRLRWASVHWDTNQISIEPNDEWRPKSNKARTVPLGPAIRPWLERLKAVNDARPPKERSPFVFTGPRRKAGLRFWPQNRFDRARKAAGLVGGPHTMRHSYASHFLANGGSLFELGRIMGHSHSKVTELYSHMLPGALDAAAARVTITPGIGPAAAEAEKKWKAGR